MPMRQFLGGGTGMPAPKGASTIFKSKLDLLGHHVLDHANNCQCCAATDATTGKLRENACDIKTASRRTRRCRLLHQGSFE
jgi:hypothetical protein